ncbi:MAG: shikimate kinase [Pseudomonadota bacterium]
MTTTKPISIIGTGGAGKTTIGVSLSQAFNIPFVDSDQTLEAEEGRTIPQIFEQEGEAYFRQKEREVIAALAGSKEPQILSTGGGAFMNPETRALLLEKTTVVFLRANLETLLSRVGNGEGRPLFDGKNPKEVLEAMIRDRYPVYEQAHITIDTDGEETDLTTQKVISALGQHLK